MHRPLSDRAFGRWPEILPVLGVGPLFLKNKHGPCPLCGGKDRFRFDDKGKGMWICNQCGSGDGVELVKRVHRLDYKAAAQMIEPLVGSQRTARVKLKEPYRASRDELNRIWSEAAPINIDTPAGQYLMRRIRLTEFPSTLRAAVDMPFREGKLTRYFPGMLARVDGPDGKPVTLHRTYLQADGQKAPVQPVRKLMSVPMPAGVAVRLNAPQDGTVGIAEGIETALSVTKLFGTPCWAVLNAAMMFRWEPPPGINKVTIFADNDVSFTGQKAAFSLANRFATAGKITVDVQVPPDAGTDWNDVWMGR